jgi:TonB family protein
MAQAAEAFASHAYQTPVDEVPIGVLEVPIGVWGSRRVATISGRPGRMEVFAEETSTVIVFPHGAVIRLSAAVIPGQMMMVANRKSTQVVPCRVVKARNYPNVRGYAEIEFFQAINNFWGAYDAQGTLKLTPRSQPAPPDKFSEDFWNKSFSQETNTVLRKDDLAAPPAVWNRARSAERHAMTVPLLDKGVQRVAVAASGAETPNSLLTFAAVNSSKPVGTLTPDHWRDEFASERSWVREFLGSLPRRRTAFAWVAAAAILIMCAGGIFLRYRGAADPAETSEGNPMLDPSAASLTANTSASARPANNSSSSLPAVPIVTNTENFPGSRDREFAYNGGNAEAPARNGSLERKILSRKPLAPPVVTHRSAETAGRIVPPNLTGVIPNVGSGTMLGGFMIPGGRVKEPRLVSKSAPNYPDTAKRAGIEGDVTVSAVVNITGKLTSMKIVSGAPLLQHAALDSLRSWKYEPASLNEKPVPVQTSITVKFRIH